MKNIDINGLAVGGLKMFHIKFAGIAEIDKRESGEYQLVITVSPEGPIRLGTSDESEALSKAFDALVERGLARAPWGFYSSCDGLWFLSPGGAIRCNNRVLRDRLEHPEGWTIPDGGYSPGSFADGGSLQGAGFPDSGPRWAVRDPHLEGHLQHVWATVWGSIRDALRQTTGALWSEQALAELARAATEAPESERAFAQLQRLINAGV